MRLPFLQVHQIDMSRGRTLARILRVPEAHGVGLAVALDAWALDEAPEGDCSGLVRDTAPAEAMALAVGWEGKPEEFLAALVRVKMVEESAEGPRVVSVQRYAKALEGPARRSESASKAAQVRWHGKIDAPRMPSAMPDDAKTQTQTQTQNEVEDLPLPPSAVPEKARRKKATERPPTDPRHAPLGLALVAAGWPHHGGRTAKALAALLAHADREPGVSDGPGEILRRAGIARAWVGFPQAREVHELASNWGHFAAPQGTGGTRPPDVRRGSVRAELIDHAKPEELF